VAFPDQAAPAGQDTTDPDITGADDLPKAPPAKWALLAGIAVLALALDQVTKAWAVAGLSDGRVISLIGTFLKLRLIRNPGAAFSIGESLTWAFTLLSAAVVVAVIIMARRVRSTPWAVILGLLLAGAAGNLTDRIFRQPGIGRGHVIDFIDYAGRFVGNVADIAIVLATIAMIIAVVWGIGWDGTRGRANSKAP
jgi:signal peptidase II